jgi:hypothetical protein
MIDNISLTTVGWIVLAAVVVALLLVVVRYLASVAVELTRVLLVAGVVLVIGVAIWLLLR